MSSPKNHHYVPVFYLKRWMGEDGRVCRFNSPNGDKLLSKRVSPGGTAYEEHLYSMRTPNGLPDSDMERDFMSKMDSEAAEALRCLDERLPETKWSCRLRSAWSRFIWAQSIRTPSEIEQLKSMVKEEWSSAIPGLQERYAELRPDDAPENVDDYLATLDPYAEDRYALSVMQGSMDHSGIGQIINNMYWKVLDFDECGIPLLTSDRPVWMTKTLAERDAVLTMPIGPSRLFVATLEAKTMPRIAAQPRRQLAKNINKFTVQHAVKFVFGIDGKMQEFVQKHFATKRHATHMERLAGMQGHRIVADDSPAE